MRSPEHDPIPTPNPSVFTNVLPLSYSGVLRDNPASPLYRMNSSMWHVACLFAISSCRKSESVFGARCSYAPCRERAYSAKKGPF